jgi:hypothetical protein
MGAFVSKGGKKRLQHIELAMDIADDVEGQKGWVQ